MRTARGEFEALVNALVVNETFFFREFAPLQVAVTQFLLPLVNSGHRPRVWCAACSTGEEPLSLAMLLEQHGILSKVELVATDVSTASARCARGRDSTAGARCVTCPRLSSSSKWLSVDG